MQIADFLRASVLNSSDSAFRLALYSDDNINFSRKIISAKNRDAHEKLARLKPKEVTFNYTEIKIKKYEDFLIMINDIEMSNSAVAVLRNENENLWKF